MVNWGNSIDVVVLAGGLGTRLQKILPDGVPKLLAPIDGKPFIDYFIEYLYRSGARRIIFALGYGAEMVQSYLDGNLHNTKIQCDVSVESRCLGTAGAISNAIPMLRSEITCVMNGDSICDINFDQMLARHLASKAKITISLTRVTDASRYGLVKLGQNDKIDRFIEKDKNINSGWINSGVYLINKEVILGIPPLKAVSLEKEIFPKYVGASMYGYRAGNQFIDIGTPESLNQAKFFFEDFPKL